MAICTKGIEVTIGGQKVLGVTDVPALGATPEKIDVTTLADGERKYINGIKDYGDLEFSCIYEPFLPEGKEGLIYKDLVALEKANNEVEIKVIIPESEAGAKDGVTISFSGRISVAMAEAAVNAAITFTLSVALSSDIVTSFDAQ